MINSIIKKTKGRIPGILLDTGSLVESNIINISDILKHINSIVSFKVITLEG